MGKGKENNNNPLDSDMDVNEAMNRFGKFVKEETKGQEPQEAPLFEGQSHLVEFKGKGIRQIFHDNEWYFSVVDVIEAVTESSRPRRYWADLKRQLFDKEAFSELSDNIVQLKMEASGGKHYSTDVVNTETLFRIIQSIPSKRAEPFKRWLAKVGYERIQEIQDPEIAVKRAMLTYKAKGYPDEWVNARIQTIVSRKGLTREWQKRGITEGLEYALLTDAISMETFDLSTKGHKNYKDLKKHHNLRDHMTPLELALTMLGETTTAELARNMNAQGFDENEGAAKAGGRVAGRARKDVEESLGKRVASRGNYLPGNKQKKLH